MALTKVSKRMLQGDTVADAVAYGADPTGVLNSSSFIQAALDSGSSILYLPAGTYRCDDTLSVPKNVSIEGAGSGVSILDFSNSTSLTDDECIRTVEGSYTALPALSSAISVGDTTIAFASAPSVSVGDLIVIYNDTDGSWSNWRTYYRAGEMVRVIKVSGSTVTIEGSFCDDYAIADVDLYKCTDFTSCRFSNFKVKGSTHNTAVDGLVLRTGVDCSIENVISTNSSYAGIELDRCFNVAVLNSTAKDEGNVDLAGDYGLIISNCASVRVQGGEFVSARHGITIGGGTGVGRIPNRYININGAYIATVGASIQAADIHGNAELVSYTNCHIDGGMTVGGDNNVISGNLIKNGVSNGSAAVYFSELKGTNHNLTGNTIINDFTPANNSRGFWIEAGGNGDIFSKATRGGTFKISDNLMITNQGILIPNGIYIYQNTSAFSGNGEIHIVISNNTMRRLGVALDILGTTLRTITISCQVRIDTGLKPWDSVRITDNEFIGGIYVHGQGSNNYSSLETVVSNNYILEGQSFFGGNRNIYLKDNVFKNQNFGVIVSGYSASAGAYAVVDGNQAINVGWQNSASTSNDANFSIGYYVTALSNDNFATQDFKFVKVQTDATVFQVGDTVTGGTSGATATVFAINHPYLFVRDSITGTFQTSETITGNNSGGSDTTDAATASGLQRSYNNSYYNNTHIYHDHNIDAAGKSNYTSSNTATTTTI